MSKNPIIHRSVLSRSHPILVIQLAFAVEERFTSLLNMWLRSKGEMITPPTYLDSDMLLWRKLVKRLRKGDFRNTPDELAATRRVADWTLLKKCELVGEVYKPIDWGD